MVNICKCGLIKNNENISLFPKVGKLCHKCNNERSRDYYLNNKSEISIRRKKLREKNYKPYKDLTEDEKNKRKESCNRSKKKRRKNDNLYAITDTIRTSIGYGFRKNGFIKKCKTIEILGCSFEDFKSHIESKFEDWMTWENRGLYNGELNYGWDIDHIIPIASAKTEEDIIKLNHYKNLQPLCSHINRDIKKDFLQY